MNTPPRRLALPSASDRRSVSAGRYHRLPDVPSPSKQEKKKKPSPSLWNWNPIRAISHFGHRRFDCRFSLHVHSIEGLPPDLAGGSLVVRWRRTTEPAASARATRPAPVIEGAAQFNEILHYRCSVYGARTGLGGLAKYEARQFMIYSSVVCVTPEIELGRHLVDLARLLPHDLDELQEDEGEGHGKWSKTFRLSGKARGASLKVSFGFSLVGGSSSGSATATERNISEVSDSKDVRSESAGQQGPVAPVGTQVQRHERSGSMEDIKVLHEVLRKSNTDAAVFDYDGRELKPENSWVAFELDALDGDAVPELKVVIEQEKVIKTTSYMFESELKPCALPEPDKESKVKNSDEPELTVTEVPSKVQLSESNTEMVACRLPEPDKESKVKNSDELELTVTEVASEVQLFESNTKMVACRKDNEEEKVVKEEEMDAKPDEQVLEASSSNSTLEESKSLPEDPVTDELVSIFEPKKSESLNLDEITDSVVSEFLSLLGTEQSPVASSSYSYLESPREQLLKEFEKELLLNPGDYDIFGIRTNTIKESNKRRDPLGKLDQSPLGKLDLSSTVQEAEAELRKELQCMNSISRAKMLEDEETKALMCQSGLDEKAFQCSSPENRGGFGSPMDLPSREPLELPALGKGFGPLIQTKDGGFLRSMSPSLFSNANRSGSLIMQVSCPVVVPAEMGSGVMEILQCMASMGVEKLSMQASKLMPLEDITGRTLHEVAWEGIPALEDHNRPFLIQHQHSDTQLESSKSTSAMQNRGKGLGQYSRSGRETSLEYGSLDDLAPMAMDKIEALCIEGLKIQSGMSDEEASSTISQPSTRDFSASEGRGSQNRSPLDLEGTAGLKLLDIKDSGEDIDGPMALCITLDEWMKLDSGIIDDEDHISDQTLKILAAHQASSMDLIKEVWKGHRQGHKKHSRRWGFMGNNFTVALMVQLLNPSRNFEPVGTPMLALVQVERIFVTLKPKLYSFISEKGNSEQEDETENKSKPGLHKEAKNEEEDAIPQFKITAVHVAGPKTEPGKRKVWGNPMHQQSGSRWLLAAGMGKSNKHPLMKSKEVGKPSHVTTTVQPGDTLWSISLRVHGTGAKWKELAALNPHIRNPNVLFPNQTIRLR